MMDDATGAEIKVIVLGIAKTTDNLETKIAAMDTKLDDNAVRIAQYGERLSNHKNLIDEIKEDIKQAINTIHEKIRTTRIETVAEAITKTKNWILVSMVGTLIAIIVSIASHFLKSI